MIRTVNQTTKQTIKAHTRLPPGGILIFVTGRHEIEYLCRKIKTILSRGRQRKLAADTKANGGKRPAAGTTISDGTAAAASAAVAGEEESEMRLDSDEEAEDEVQTEKSSEPVEKINPEDPTPKPAPEGGDGAAAGADGSEAEDEPEDQWARMSESCDMKVRLLPLYSLLPTHQQMKVFEPAKAGERVIVVATNVAETSLTIPGIRYVIDSGREKRKVYDRNTSSFKFEIGWISQASASQRSGRAGRTGPGHCYRMYSSAVFQNQFSKYSQPEILTTPIDSVLLHMKVMNIQRLSRFPFPTPPDQQSIRDALRTLTILGAIITPSAAAASGSVTGDGDTEQITALGRALAAFPIAPRFAKMLILAHQSGVLSFMVAIVAALSVGELSLPTPSALIAKPKADGSAGSDSEGEDDTTTDRKSKSKAKSKPSISADDDSDGDGGGSGDDDPEAAAAARAQRQRERALDEEREKKAVAKREQLKQERRDYQKRVLESKLKWTNRDSDLLTFLNLVGGYEYAEQQWRNKRAAKLQAATTKPAAAAATTIKRKSSAKPHPMQQSGDDDASDRKSGDAEDTAAEEGGSEGGGGGGGWQFCQDNFLRIKAMREIQSLRRQLHHIIQKIMTASAAAAAGTDASDASTTKPAPTPQPLLLAPPTKSQQLLLRQIICSGFVDRVARKLTKSEIDHLIRLQRANEPTPPPPGKSGAPGVASAPAKPRTDMHNNVISNSVPISRLSQAYQTLQTSDDGAILIHPASALSLMHPSAGAAPTTSNTNEINGSGSGSGSGGGALPEWIVYHDMMRSSASSGRLYMRDVTSVEPDWISRSKCPLLVHYSKPVNDPPPKYEAASDTFVCWCHVTFGYTTIGGTGSGDVHKSWSLPLLKIPFPNTATTRYTRIQHLCRLWLDGQVCTQLLEFRMFFTNAKPSVLLTLSESQLANVKHTLSVSAKSQSQPVTTGSGKKHHPLPLATGSGLKLISVLHCFLEREIDSKRKLLQIW